MQFAVQTVGLENQITSLGINTVLIASIILVVCTVLAMLLKNRIPALKLPLFLVMAVTLVMSAAILFGSTVYLNVKAESGGPVHWHSDIEFWACGAEMELQDPSGLFSNKIGTATYHEHNDKRIHLEGVVVRKSEDASLEKFMQVTGGYIHDSSIGIPLNQSAGEWFATGEKLDGDQQPSDAYQRLRSYVSIGEEGSMLQLNNGQTCGNTPAEIQVFVYSYDKSANTYAQRKLADPSAYIMRNESVVPPGDCVIVEFDRIKERTDKLCEQYGVRDSRRCVEFGVKSYDPSLCNITEVVSPEETF
jgi:hypothetical protein